jgi:membrane protease YdiL (CAAX protease family)
MLISMVLPLAYAVKYKRDSLIEIGVITFTMIFIVVAYWPLILGLNSTSNIVTKFLLFVFVPLVFLFITWKIRNKQKKKKQEYSFKQFGITEEGFEKSLKLGFLFLPIMLMVTFITKYMIGGTLDGNFSLGVVSFVESFTEEFFFRGILFLFLMSRTNLKIAYVTSLASFVLMHPQNFTNPFIISTIVQGFLTIEICRRSKNLVGAWVLHGTNRFFSIVIIPFLF